MAVLGSFESQNSSKILLLKTAFDIIENSAGVEILNIAGCLFDEQHRSGVKRTISTAKPVSPTPLTR